MIGKGQPVIVIASDHSMVNPGERGVIDCLHGKGYGVAITKAWPAVHGRPTEERRVIWFAAKGTLKLATESTKKG
jgi:hypothetical protein